MRWPWIGQWALAWRSYAGLAAASLPLVAAGSDQMALSARKTPVAPLHQRAERMHFDFQDIPIRAALQLIASGSGFNLIVGDDVQGRVSLHLHDVSWPEALTALLRAKGLDQQRQGRVIWVATQKTLAAYQHNQAQLAQQRAASEPLRMAYLPISYGDAENIAKLLAQGARAAQPGTETKPVASHGFLSSRGTAAFDKRTNTLLLYDSAARIAEIRRLVAVLDQPVQQVLIEARIVVAQQNFLRELGMRLNLQLSAGQRHGAPDTPRATGSIGVDLPAGESNGVLGLAILGRHYALDLALQAAQNEGQSHLLSSPQAVVANNQEADIQQGQQIGYVTYRDTRSSTDRGSGTATVSFKNAVLELKVTPTVTADRRIYLKIQLSKDALQRLYTVPGSGQVPLIDHRSMNTTVLVDDAQTVVLGGIQEQEEVTERDKVPGLAKIPLLGRLFRHHGRRLEQGQLLIFVKPSILPLPAH